MKIGYVLDDSLDNADGAQQYIVSLSRYLADHGHEVRYLVGETQRTDLPGIYSMSTNIKVRFNGNRLSIPLLSKPGKVKKVLKTEKFDVLHIQVPYHPFMGARVVRHADPKTAVVGTFHILPFGWLAHFGTRLLGLYLRRNLKRFDSMIAVSKPTRIFARETFKVDSIVIPNMVDLSLFQPKIPPKPHQELRILFLGRLVERKGCLQLLNALELLANQDKLPKNIHIDICGKGDLQPQLEKLVKNSKLHGYVSFHGFVSIEQKIEFMQNADIAVFPALSGESFGIVLIEAMAAGSGVVLGGNNPGYSSVLEAIPESILNVHAVDSMASQLESFIIDPQKRAAVHAQQQDHVRQFDIKVVAQQILEEYQACKNARADR